jgi:DNA topoisomerase-1
MDLVDAQQARRILDRIVGYKLSPLLWRKVRPACPPAACSRVATRHVVDRENEIRAFKPQEYWNLDVQLLARGRQATKALSRARFYGRRQKERSGRRAGRRHASSKGTLEGAPYTVSRTSKNRERQAQKAAQPGAPFITSTLQQEASPQAGHDAKRTMIGRAAAV